MGAEQFDRRLKRTQMLPLFVVFWSNPIKSNLYKADTSIKRTIFNSTNGILFGEIPLYLHKCSMVLLPLVIMRRETFCKHFLLFYLLMRRLTKRLKTD